MTLDTIEWFTDWLTAENPARPAVDREALAAWLKPHMQNYVDGDFFRVNPNGRALSQLRTLLTAPAETAADPALTAKSAGSRKAAVPKTKRLLLVSQYAPSYSHAGGLRIRDLYAELRKARPDLVIDLYCMRHEMIDGDLSGLGDIFDNVYNPPAGHPMSFNDFAEQAGSTIRYDLIDLQFHEAGRLARSFALITRRMIFTPMESVARSYYDIVAAKLAAENYISLHDVFGLIQAMVDELKIVTRTDATVCVSDADASFLSRMTPWRKFDHIPTGLSPYEFETQLGADFRPKGVEGKQKRLVYAAYFGSDTNVVGLRWYLDHVHPHVLDAVPNYSLMVVGRGDLNAMIAEGRRNVNWVGEVPYLAPVVEQARAGLVLALHGSGFRGKINQYAICGVPTVSTPLGATGLCYEDGVDIALAKTAPDFAAQCIRMLTDDDYASAMASKARMTALANYTWDTFEQKIAKIYGL